MVVHLEAGADHVVVQLLTPPGRDDDRYRIGLRELTGALATI